MKKIIISGASGFLGQAIAKHLSNEGYTCLRLVRRKPTGADEIFWDPYNQEIDSKSLEGSIAMINLSGESISGLRWSEAKKQRLHDSRVLTSRFLVDTIETLTKKPNVFISASGIGFYGDQGDKILDEDDRVGKTFLATLCSKWEEESLKLSSPQTRSVAIRLGIVLSDKGGVLPAMKLPFSLGLGGRVGNGKQFVSWIDIVDFLAIISHLLIDSSLSGAINVCSPKPIQNIELTKALGRALNRPTIFPLPAFVVKSVLGEMGEALLLNSTRAIPRKLEKSGFSFQYSDILDSLKKNFKPLG
ncbi:UNVERIFIED_CONTAM: hypothetical protein GTU68_053370 [Idotea baltica]|nr:hypothetical protein [Idotea baltica]